MFYSDEEEKVIHKFYTNSRCLTKVDVLTLVWDEGTILATFDTDYDDEDDETDETMQYFVFEFVSQIGKSPFEFQLKTGELFEITYHNFPNAILLNGVKLN